MFARALLAFIAMPGMVAFAIPFAWLWQSGQLRVVHPWGLTVLLIGAVGLLRCVRDFYVQGEGTLAPWAPPERLVVVGPYRWSRNPMYVSVLLVLLGWAAAFASAALLGCPSPWRCAWRDHRRGPRLGVDIAKAALTSGHAVIATGRDPRKVAAAIGKHDELLAVRGWTSLPSTMSVRRSKPRWPGSAASTPWSTTRVTSASDSSKNSGQIRSATRSRRCSSAR